MTAMAAAVPAVERAATPGPPVLVSKFGGSSLASPAHIAGVADRIAGETAPGTGRVVVVSAMGDTTDDLLALAGQVARRPDPRELDLLLATGEHISAALLAMALEERGIEATALTGSQAGIRTDGRHGRARITDVEPERIRRELGEGRVVVVAGFQGDAGEEIVTLGRGGSDTSAVALAIALGARRCEIFTDVDGVYTADPRLVPEARRLEEIGHEEMLELAHQGAKVLQVRSVELGWLGSVEIAVRHSTGTGPGTLIRRVTMEARQKVRGIATEDGVAKLTLLGLPDHPGIAGLVFEPLAEAGVGVEGVIQNIGHDGLADLSFIVPQADLDRATDVIRTHFKAIGARDLSIRGGLAKVSIVGTGIANASTYPARMFGELARAGVNIEMISTSEIRITCVIRSEHLALAARTLHRAFELEAA
jgi:aspartate kinase